MSIGGDVERLVEIMARLRAPGGCPWDREQDLRSLRPYLVEECYEVLEEMDRVGAGGPWAPLCEELGDLLFQIVFHAQLASEQGAFDLGGVSRAISDKITSRHPHVFGEQQVEGSTQVLANWAKLKAEERKRKTGSEGSVLDGVPRGAPALLRAERLSEKASRIGFDWPDLAGVRAKLDEELAELDEAIASGDRDHKEHELGDVLFSLANLARFIETPAEDALRQANLRFTSRFQRLEQELREEGIAFGAASLERMEAAWQAAKATEARIPPPRATQTATLARLELTAPSLARQKAFWDRISPILGWQALETVPGEACYSDGGLTVRFTEGPPSTGLALILTVPAPASAAAALQQAGVEVQSEGGAWLFPDPAGIRWRLAASGA